MQSQKIKSSIVTGALSFAFVGLIACSSTPTVQTPAPSPEQSTPSASVAPQTIDRTSRTPDATLFQTPDVRDKLAGAYRLKAPIRRRLKSPIKDVAAGVEIPFYEFSAGFDVDKDGGENRSLATKVKLDGFGEHELMLNIEDYPIMDNREDIYVVTDKKTKISTTMLADQDLFNYTLKQTATSFAAKQVSGEVRIETQPDGSWLVNGKSALSPQFAAQLMMKEPVIQNTPIHTIALLLASVRAAAHRDQLEFIDLPYDKIDKNMLADIGDLVDESQLESFKDSAFFTDKDFEKLDSEAFFDADIDFGEFEEAVTFEGELFPEETGEFPVEDDPLDESQFPSVDEPIDGDDFESTQVIAAPGLRRDPIWGDLSTRTLFAVSCRMEENVANDYGNPEPILAALLDLMKAERSAK